MAKPHAQKKTAPSWLCSAAEMAASPEVAELLREQLGEVPGIVPNTMALSRIVLVHIIYYIGNCGNMVYYMALSRIFWSISYIFLHNDLMGKTGKSKVLPLA